MDRRSNLREFLTSRRGRISPEQAGLPNYGGHRRVPGLRREEVALLAGVSIAYYARLERGDANGVSDSVLDGLAQALHLDDAERAHLFGLTRPANPAAGIQRRPAPGRIRPAVQKLLDAMADVPAIVRNGRLDVLAANALGRALYDELFDGAAALGLPGRPARLPNFARFDFLDPRSVDFYADWPRTAADGVALLRAELGRHPDDRALSDLVGELATRSKQFAGLWATHDVRRHTAGSKHFRHHLVGDLELAYESLELVADPGLTVTTYTPEPASPSADAIRLLASWAATTSHSAQQVGNDERAR